MVIKFNTNWGILQLKMCKQTNLRAARNSKSNKRTKMLTSNLSTNIPSNRMNVRKTTNKRKGREGNTNS